MLKEMMTICEKIQSMRRGWDEIGGWYVGFQGRGRVIELDGGRGSKILAAAVMCCDCSEY